MDCGDYYHEAQSGKSKRENRENNGHMVRTTFTPNKLDHVDSVDLKNLQDAHVIAKLVVIQPRTREMLPNC